ncbi:MAG TPA: PAS domain S-box protein [Gemmatales bacterium]|nr:PAS domain S-box protein [Gemmatales bacterium]
MSSKVDSGLASAQAAELDALRAELDRLRSQLDAEAAHRQQLESDLKRLQRRFEVFQQYSSDGQAWLDAEGRLIAFAASHERLTGFPPEAHLQAHVFDLAMPDEVDAVRAALERVRSDPKEVAHFRGRMIDASGQERWVDAAFVNLLADPDIGAIVIHYRDVTQGLASEAERQRTAQLMETIVDASPLAIFSLDRETRVTSWNRAAEEMFGWRAADILGQRYPLVPTGREEEFRYIFERNLRGMAVHGIDLVRQRQDGSLMEIALYTAPLRDASGEVAVVVSLARDVTEENRAARRLAESEQRFRRLVQQSPDLIFECSPEGTLVSVSPACQAVLGTPPRSVLGRPLASLAVPEDAPRLAALCLPTAAADTERPPCTVRLLHPEGQTLFVEFHIAPEWREGELRRWHGIARDITDRHLALEELQRSRRFIARVADATPTLIYVYDLLEDRNVYANEQVARQLGYSLEEVRAPGFLVSLVHPDDLSALAATVASKRAATDADLFEHALRLRRSDGVYRTFQNWEVLFERDPDGGPRLMLGIGLDVTEREHSQAALREKQQLVENLAAAVPDSLYLIDLNRELLVYQNNRIEEQLGWSAADLVQFDTARFEELVHPDDRPLWHEHRQRRHAATPGDVFDHEIRIRHRDGNWRWIRSRERVFARDPEGTSRFAVGTSRDVTQRKLMEVALQRSEAQLRQLIQNADDIILLYDVEGRIQFGYAPARYGIDEQVWIGRTPLELFEQRLGTMLMGQIQMVLATQQPHIFENCLPWAGREYWFSDHLYPIRDPDGRITGVGRICRDVTVQKQAEAAAQERAHFSQRIVSSSPSLVFTLHVHERTVGFISGNVARILGYEPAELLQMGAQVIPYLTHPDERGLIDDLLTPWQHAADGEILKAEYRLRRRDGSWRWFQSWAVVFARDSSGAVTHILSNALDVTEHKSAELERQRQAELHRDLEQRMAQAQKPESLGVLAGGIAHDFNNLLTAVLGNSALALMRPALGGDLTDLLQQIQLAAQRAAELTHQLLAYAGKGKIIIQPLSVNQLVQEMMRLLGSIVSRQAVFQLDLASDLSLVEADATQMRQILMNLITNASDALEGRSGSIVLRTSNVELTAVDLERTLLHDSATPGRYVLVEVQDTGCGMDAATQQRMFDPFYTTKFTGRGLGLAAVLGIVRSHQGTLAVESEPGRGTTFRLYLPASDLPLPTPVHTVPVQAAAGSILVAIEDSSVRELTRRLLEKCGYRPLPVRTGREAIELCALKSQEVVLAVIDPAHLGQPLPEMLLRLREQRPSLGVVLIVRGFSSGPEPPGDVVTIEKPFNPASLIQAVKEALALKEVPLNDVADAADSTKQNSME